MKACPATDCRSASGRVWTLTPSAAEDIGEPWVSDGSRCAYCGTVFTGRGTSAIIRGWYDNPMGKLGWTPKTQ